MVPTPVLREVARAPAAMGGALGWLVLACAVLEPARSLLVLVEVAALGALTHGRVESAALRMLYGARRPAPWERAVLDRLVAVCPQLLPAGDICVTRHGRVPIWPGGRRLIVVPSAILMDPTSGQLDERSATAWLAHSVGRQRAGATRVDVVTQVLALPWVHVLRPWVAAAGRLPLIALAWRCRLVVAAIAVVRSVDAGRADTAVILAVLATLSYASPLCREAWTRRVDLTADAFVAACGLGPEWIAVLTRQPQTRHLAERLEVLRTLQTAGEGSARASRQGTRRLSVVR